METRRRLRRRLPAALFAALASALHAPALNQPHEEMATGDSATAPSHASPSHLLESTLRPPAYRLWETAAFGSEASERADRGLVDAWNESLFAGFEPAEREAIWSQQAEESFT